MSRDTPDPRPRAFSLSPHRWQGWLPGSPVLNDADSDAPVVAVAPSPELRSRLARAEEALSRRHRGGLSQGERALAMTAVARRTGCFQAAARHGRIAVAGLKRLRPVELLLEEGLPNPQTGRLGAVIQLASSLSAVPARPERRDLWKLQEEGMDDQEIVDLILVAGHAAHACRIALVFGETRKEDP